MKMKLSVLAASAILAVGITGCWTENAPTPAAAAYVAKAIDGYIANATGCFDVNNDGECTVADVSITTDASGNYDVPSANTGHKVILSGGTDLDTGNPFTGVLKAPAGSKVASPLTTLLADGMTIAQINTLLGTNLTETSVTNDFRGTSYNADVAKAAATVQALIGTLASSVKAASSEPLTQSQIMAKVVSAIEATPALVLTNAATIEAQLANVATVLNNDTTLNISITPAAIATDLKNTVTTVTAQDFSTDAAANAATSVVETQITNNTANTDLTKSVTIANNTFTVGSQTTSFTQNGAFSSLTVPSSNVSVSFTLENNNDELNATAKTIDIAITIDDTTSSPRNLKAILVGATITGNGTTSTITVPANAKMYVQGMSNSSTVPITVELTDLAADDFISANGVTTFNLTNIMSRIEAKVPSDHEMASITKEGNYDIAFYISGLVLGLDGTPTVKALTAPEESVSVATTSGTRTMTGTKFTGNLTITQ